MSVAIVALQRSDKRLLAAAMQLGPYIQEAAAQLAAKKDAPDASADSSSASSSPAKPLAHGNAARKQSPGMPAGTQDQSTYSVISSSGSPHGWQRCQRVELRMAILPRHTCADAVSRYDDRAAQQFDAVKQHPSR